MSLYEKCAGAEYGFTQQEFSDLLTEAASRSLGAGHSVRAREQFVKTLHIEDLVLARACARGCDPAWDRFLSLYRQKLNMAACAIARDEALGRELADSLYADLYGTRVRDDGRRISKLDGYSGRGSLEGWLRAVLAQEYVNRFRVQRKVVPFDETIESHQATELQQPEPNAQRFADAIDAELAALPAEERVLLAGYYLDGRTLAEIGRMLDVHESTISRRLEKVTAGLRKRIVTRLCRAGMSKHAAEEMLKLDVSDLGLDLRNRLTQERQA